ncbi:MAG: restriction endonuclease subunit S [Anaerolineaceae bacterium]
MNKWSKTTLGDICIDISYGYTASAKVEPVGPKFLRITDIVPNRINWENVPYCDADSQIFEKYKLENGDIVIARTGATTGYNKIIKEINFNAVFASYLIRYKVDTNKAYPFFIGYILQSSNWYDYVDAIIGGSAQPGANAKQFRSYEILLPPLAEQRAIASVLSSLDDKIDLLQRQNKTLEAMAETLYRQWFVEEASEDWEEILLKDIYMFDKGFEPGSRNYLEKKEADSIRFIRVGDMLDPKASTYIKKEPGQITCGKKDLLVSFDGTIGRVSFGIEGAYSSGIRKVYSLDPIYNSLGLKYLLFTSREIQDVIKSHSSGTVIAHAGSSIDYLTFRFPKKNRLQEFNQITDPMFFKITKNLNQIETLEKLRNALLPKLISGEVRVI